VGCSLNDFVAQVPAASEGDISVWEYMYHEVQVRGREMCERNLLHHYHNNKVSPPPRTAERGTGERKKREKERHKGRGREGDTGWEVGVRRAER
jgi:hypothetical protein